MQCKRMSSKCLYPFVDIRLIIGHGSCMNGGLRGLYIMPVYCRTRSYLHAGLKWRLNRVVVRNVEKQPPGTLDGFQTSVKNICMVKCVIFILTKALEKNIKYICIEDYSYHTDYQHFLISLCRCHKP